MQDIELLLKELVIKDAIVQVNKKGPNNYIGCFVVIEHKSDTEIIGFIPTPNGRVYVKLPWEQLDFIGYSALRDLKSQGDDSEEHF